MYCDKCFAISPNQSTRCIQCGNSFLKPEPKLSKAPEKKSFSPAGVVGMFMGLYLGVYVFVLGVTYVISVWGGKRYLPADKTTYIQTISIQISLIVAITISTSFVYIKGLTALTPDFILFDVIAPWLGLLWLYYKPGIKPVIALTIYQSIVLIVNSISVVQTEIGSPMFKALIAYILFRIAAIYFLWFPPKQNVVSNKTERM